MPDGSANLDALRILLASAQSLASTLEGDGALRRIIRAVAALTPEDRDVLAGALERAAATRWKTEIFGPVDGVHLRVNPHPRLFVRVHDADRSADAEAIDEEDLVPDVLRLMRRVRTFMTPASRQIWHPAVVDALGMLSDADRDACLQFVQDVVALIGPLLTTSRDAADNSDEPS